MADITLLPRHHYLSLPIGAFGYNGTSAITMPEDGYNDVTGIYTTSASPSLVFKITLLSLIYHKPLTGTIFLVDTTGEI